MGKVHPFLMRKVFEMIGHIRTKSGWSLFLMGTKLKNQKMSLVHSQNRLREYLSEDLHRALPNKDFDEVFDWRSSKQIRTSLRQQFLRKTFGFKEEYVEKSSIFVLHSTEKYFK